MRAVSSECREVLASGDYAVEWVADLLYDDDPRAQNLRLLEPKFRWDGSAQIQGSGSCGVLADDMFGQSIVPREIGDLFSPFGAELQVDVRVRAGEFVERIPMGRFVLDAVPSAVEYAVANPNPPRVPVYSPWVEQRRNFAVRPTGASGTTGWTGTGASTNRTIAVVSGAGPQGRDAWQFTGNPGGGWFQKPSTIGLAVTPGQVVSLSAALKGVPGSLVEVNVTGVRSGSEVILTTKNVAISDSWERYGWEGYTVPPNVTYVALGIRSATSGASPLTWLVGDIQYEMSPTSTPFLYGSQNPTGVLKRTRWIGALDASASVLESREITSWVTGHAEPVIVESTVDLDLSDYFMRVARDEFPFPTSPKSTSMWDEAQRLTGLPVFRSIDDRVLPTNITYEKDRLEALGKVFGPSNAWPALTSQGALTARPKAWPDPVGRLDRVLDVSSSMRSENVYNRVVVEGKNPDPNGRPLIAVAEITDGFLRVRNPGGGRSPFGGATYNYQSEFLTTQAMCQQTANDMLPRVARLRSATKRVTIPFNPLFETGDVLTLVDPSRMGEESLVRVQTIEHSGAETVLEVEVRE